MSKILLLAKVTAKPARTVAPLLADVRELILAAREQVARAVDSGLVTLSWHIGRRIRQDILKEKRAEYGAEIVATLSRQLEAEFGRGFAEKNVRRMVQFAEAFPDERIVATLRRQLGWSHFKEIVPQQDELKRDFYAEMCRIERWSVRTLRKKIGGMLYERTALSRKPDKLIRHELAALREEDKLTPDLVFRDPYVLDFLGLRDTYAEKDLEAAILREMEAFILEPGVGFAFLERQKRITVDSEDHYLDLLFYHRHLRRLVAIDLKLEEFKPGNKGQSVFREEKLPLGERMQTATVVRQMPPPHGGSLGADKEIREDWFVRVLAGMKATESHARAPRGCKVNFDAIKDRQFFINGFLCSSSRGEFSVRHGADRQSVLSRPPQHSFLASRVVFVGRVQPRHYDRGVHQDHGRVRRSSSAPERSPSQVPEWARMCRLICSREKARLRTTMAPSCWSAQLSTVFGPIPARRRMAAGMALAPLLVMTDSYAMMGRTYRRVHSRSMPRSVARLLHHCIPPPRRRAP